jgi:hypothetical protein
MSNVTNIATKRLGKITKYYSFAKLDSYNARYNMAVGGRGIGKTYGKKVKAVRDAIRRGEQFIYVRRYREELQLAKETFFSDFQHVFEDWDFRTQGRTAQMSPASQRDKKKREWKTIGFFVALSQAQSYKSVNFELVKTIIFDEFIIEKSATHYLPNEAIIFNNFFSTVDRYKDKTRVYFLANSVAVTNPYFIYYKIEPGQADNNGFLKIDTDGFMICHFIDSKEFENEVYKTQFGKFIQGTEYADYAVGNQFGDNHTSLIDEKTSRARYMFTLETASGVFSVWYDMVADKYFCQDKRPKDETIVTLEPERMSEKKTLMTFADKPLAMLRTAFRHDRVRFDRAPTRNAFLEIFKR